MTSPRRAKELGSQAAPKPTRSLRRPSYSAKPQVLGMNSRRTADGPDEAGWR
jgi:hypothetical protein